MLTQYKLTTRAEHDIESISDYTLENWGIAQAEVYMHEMHDCMMMLAENNLIGRDAFEFASDLRRFPFKAHTIFYKPTQNGIQVIRILGKTMDFTQHL